MCMWKPINGLVVFSYQFGVAIKPGHDCMYHSSDVFMCALEFRWLYNFLGKVSHQMDMFTGLSLKLFPCCIINDVNSSLSTYNLHIGVIWLKVNMAGWQTIDMQPRTFRYVRMCVCDLGNGRNQQNLKHISGVISQPISIYFYATIQAKWAAGLYCTARMYAYKGMLFFEIAFLSAKIHFWMRKVDFFETKNEKKFTSNATIFGLSICIQIREESIYASRISIETILLYTYPLVCWEWTLIR